MSRKNLSNTSADNNLKAAALFKTRKSFIFNSLAKNFDGVATLDSKIFFGKLNHQRQPVIVKEDYLKRFESNQDILGLCFVVDAFEHMRSYVQSKATTSPILLQSIKSPIINLKPKTGYVDFATEYEKYTVVIYNTLLDYFAQKNYLSEIKTFKDFVECVVDFFIKTGGEFPITKTGFLTSRFCPSHVGALYIDVSEDKMSEDAPKKKILNSDVFNFYRNTAKKFGFLIDANKPSRLIFNINSPASQRYFNLYNTTSKPYYMDNEGKYSQMAADGHVHQMRYTIFGDNKGAGYTTHVIHDGVIYENGINVHVHKLEGFNKVIKARSIERNAMGKKHIHKIVPIKKEQFFGHFYNRAIHDDITGDSTAPSLRQLMAQLYNKFIVDFPTVKKHEFANRDGCVLADKSKNNLEDWRHNSPQSTKSSLMLKKSSPRQELSSKEFDINFGFEYFMPVYIKLRILESSMSNYHEISENISRKVKKSTYNLGYSDVVEKVELYIQKELHKQQVENLYQKIYF